MNTRLKFKIFKQKSIKFTIYWNKLFYFCIYRELDILLKFMLFQSSHNIITILYSNKNNKHIKFKKKKILAICYEI